MTVTHKRAAQLKTGDVFDAAGEHYEIVRTERHDAGRRELSFRNVKSPGQFPSTVIVDDEATYSMVDPACEGCGAADGYHHDDCTSPTRVGWRTRLIV